MKFDKLWKAYKRFIEEYEKREPDWVTITALELVRNSLQSLRQYIQDPEVPDISWEKPGAELQYPVDWKWENHEQGAGGAFFGGFTEEDCKNPETIVSKMTAIFQKHREFFALDLLTHHVAYLKRGDHHAPILPENIKAELDQLPEDKRTERIGELYKAFYFGAVDEESPLLEGDRPRPSLRVTSKDDDGRLRLDVHVAVDFYPLVVDELERRAFYPVIVGLGFVVSEELLSPESPAWTGEVDDAFWKHLDNTIDQEIAELSRLRKIDGAPLLLPETRSDQEAATPPTFPEPAVIPPTEMSFPLSFGHALADKETLDFLTHVHRIRLPAKKWSELPSWKKLKAVEVERILAERGERAFENPGRGALLKRRPKNPDVIELTAEAERNLKIREGLKHGYRLFDRPSIKEYSVRLFQVGNGYIEVGLSWYGIAGPWVQDWRRELQKTADRFENSQRDLPFDDLDEDRKEEIDRLIRWAQILEDGRKVMEMVIGQVARQSQNPIQIPALALKVLLGLENDPHWKVRVDGGLNALLACSFMLKSFQMSQVKGYGNFLGEWWYDGAGPGAHGEGDYFLDVQPGFLGCLSVFLSGRRRLDSKHEVNYYDFGKKLTRELKESQNWGRKARAAGLKPKRTFLEFDAGRVFYNAAEGLSPARQNLVAFLEAEITLQRDSVSRKLGNYENRKSIRTRPTAEDAKKPRLYSKDECPLLQEGKLYHGALGHFRPNPESGRTLYGTGRRSSETGGPHTEGLISVLGHSLPPGVARRERRQVVRQALEDIKAVVVDYLGGVAAARGTDKTWMTLQDVAGLQESKLVKQTKWFFFLPETWKDDRRRRWESVQKERAARGETPFAWTVTEDKGAAREARFVLAQRPAGIPQRPWVPRTPQGAMKPTNGGENQPTGLRQLEDRLRAARLKRKLSLEAVGKIFGVSKMTVSYWEAGTEPHYIDGKVHGKPIPRELIPMMERWIDTGQAPTPEELAARKTRRSGVKSDAKNRPHK